MKANIKRLAVFVIIAAIVMFIPVSMVSAAQPVPHAIKGEYAGTGAGQCLIAPTGFTNLIANPLPGGTDPVAVIDTSSWEVVFTFNKDGTGTVTGVYHYNELPNAALSIPPNAGSANLAWDFTYTATAAGDITFTLANNSFNCDTFVSGPNKGQTACSDNIPNDGVISKDGKTITVTCGPPLLLNAVDSKGKATGTQLSCVISLVLTKQ